MLAFLLASLLLGQETQDERQSRTPPGKQRQQQQQQPAKPQEELGEEAATEQTGEAQGEPGDKAEAVESPPPPPPPLGVLPIGEFERLVYAPRDRPQVYLTSSHVVVTTTGGTVDAYESASGAFAWKLGLPGEPLFPPTAFDEDGLHLLVAGRKGHVLELDVATGEIVKEWSFSFEIATMPVVANTRLYLGTGANEVVAIDISLGHELFRVGLSERPTALALHEELLVVSGDVQSLTALRATDGDELWVFKARGAFRAAAVFNATGERLYIGNDTGDFYSIRTANGKPRFRWPTGAAIRSPARVEGKIVYLTTYANTLFAFNSGNGHELWRLDLPGRPASSPLRAHRRLLVATQDGILVEVDAQTGRETARMRLPSEVFTEPALFVPPPQLTVVGELGDASAVLNTEEDSVPETVLATTTAPPRHTTSSVPSSETTATLPIDGVLDPDLAGAPEKIEEIEDRPLAWFERARVAVPLRTGEVLLLKHDRPAPVEPPDSLTGETEDGIELPERPEGAGATTTTTTTVPPKK